MGDRGIFTALLVILSLCSVVLSLENPADCAQHFKSIYQQSDDLNYIQQDNPPTHEQKWTYDEDYDFFGNRAEQSPLPRSSDLFSADLEGEINMQINKELFIHYTFLSMAFHFYRDDINLPGFHKYFKMAARERMKHAHMFIEYLLKRGGRLKLNQVMTPCRHHWGGGLMAMEDALTLQKEVLHSLRRVHALANQKNDSQMTDFIEGNFFTVQTDRVKQLSDYVNTLGRIDSDPLGEYHFDKLTLSDGGDK
ncbi:soma ferritin-like [Oculina patagonica]